MNEKLYRVIVKTTSSLQPSGTFWDTGVAYCGYDRSVARQQFHASSPEDYHYGYGNRCRRTEMEIISDADTSDFSDDTVESES